MGSRTALIVIGTFKDEWWGLAPVAQAEFVQQVGKIANAARLKPVVGYRLTATPGAFIEVWEGADLPAVERAVKDLQAMGYTHYIEARWLIGDRQVEESDGQRPPPADAGARSAPKPVIPSLRRSSHAVERGGRRRSTSSATFAQSESVSRNQL